MPDYYIENGLYVFTAEFHLKRGYCCKSKCRHCPYGFTHKKSTSEKEENASQKTDKSENKKSD